MDLSNKNPINNKAHTSAASATASGPHTAPFSHDSQTSTSNPKCFGYQVGFIDFSNHPNATRQTIYNYLANDPSPQACKRISLATCKQVDDSTLQLIGSKYPHLKKLYLHSNALITDKGLSVLLRSCTGLKKLSVVNCTSLVNPFTGNKNQNIALNHLKIGRIWWLSPNVVQSLVNLCPNIVKLNLKSLMGTHSLEQSFVQLITAYKNLNLLSIDSWGLTDRVLYTVGQQSKALEYLKLDACKDISQNGLIALMDGCSQLKHLSLIDNEAHITRSFLKTLADRCLNLEHLVVDPECDLKMTAQTILELSQKCKQLKEITLACGDTLNINNWKQIIANLPNLENLSIGPHKQINDDYLKEIASHSEKLSALTIIECGAITGNGLITVANNRPNLRYLSLINCESITNENLIETVKKLPNLESFYVTGGYQTTDDCLQTLGESCPKLINLSLQGFEQITDKGLTGIASKLRNLKSLDLKGCMLITLKGLTSIAVNLPSLYQLAIGTSVFQNQQAIDHQQEASITLPCLEELEIDGSNQESLLASKFNDFDLLKNHKLLRRNLVSFIQGCENLRELFIHNYRFIENQDLSDGLKNSELIKSIIICDHPSEKAQSIFRDLKTFIESKHHLVQLSAGIYTA